VNFDPNTGDYKSAPRTDHRLLVVDDDQAMADLIVGYLRDRGFECEVAYDGAAGLKKFQEKGNIDIVITDMQMPIMDGLTLIENIKKINTTARIIAMSGTMDLDIAVNCLKLGANDYIKKPLKPVHVMAAIDLQSQEVKRANAQADHSVASEVLVDATRIFNIEDKTLAEKLNLFTQLLNATFAGDYVILTSYKPCIKLLKVLSSTNPELNGKSIPIDESLTPGELTKRLLKAHHTDALIFDINHDGAVVGTVAVSERTSEEKLRRLQRFLQISGFLFSFLRTETDEKTGSDKTNINNILRMSMLGDMSVALINDIINPLQIATLHADRLRARVGVDAETMAMIEKMNISFGVVRNAIQSFHQIIQGDVKVAKELTSVKKMITTAVSSLKQKTANLKVPVGIECDPNLMIECRPNDLVRVLTNLISNAMDVATDVHMKLVTVKVTGTDEKNAVFEVSNHGDPIPKDVVKHMYDQFFTTKLAGKGSGLGLYIAKKLVGEHNGEITYFRDDLNRTVFQFTVKEESAK
jgi:DNA-binding response OmpR family regulator/signal transduction histidine kinase